MKKTMLAAVFLTIGSYAQEATTNLLPVPQRDFDEVRQYLVLTDPQIASLQAVQQTRQNAEKAIYDQIQERHMQMDRLLQAGSTDAATLGRLLVEINNLRRQLPLNTAPYRQPALAVLNDAQRAKLPALTQAMQLNQAAFEAVSLNLIDGPPQVRILPLPAFVERSAQPEISSNR